MTSDVPSRQRFLPLLLLLFAGSGCAALIYEIVWFQLLQLVIGSSAVSLGVLLGTFMGGMCLGSLILPRVIPRHKNPLKVYATLELGIGLIALAVVWVLPAMSKVYIANSAQGFTGILLRGGLCGICLLPPTLLMGATLPAMARWIESTPNGISWMGFFYGGNIAGAVLGCLTAGFYLLRVHDMATATYVAAVINGLVALAGFLIAKFAGQSTTLPVPSEKPTTAPRPGSRIVYVAIALSGMSALGAEVVWTRILSLLIGATVYTFSIILAVFLIGLGIGSTVGSFLARDIRRPRMALGVCQILLTLAIGWTAYMLADSLPYWPINPALAVKPWFNFQIDLARCFWAILPATILWGASFPLALAAAAAPGEDSGRMVGAVYAANTVGAILGAIVTSLFLIRYIGTRHAEQALIGVAAVSGLLVLAPYAWRSMPAGARQSNEDGLQLGWLAGLVVALVTSLVLIKTVHGIPGELVAYGRYLSTRTETGKMLFVGEGLNSSVAVSLLENGVRNFHVSGKIEASTEPQDMRLQRMLGHLPALVHPNPKSVLIVGCGAGVTAGSFVPYGSIEKIVICELEPLIPSVVATYFGKENHNVLRDRRLKIVYDDARHFVLTTPEKFDIITSDPIHPWVKGAATLYTKEYFQLCTNHLNPGGVITQWVPLYESSPEVVKSEIATFFSVFPNGTVWNNDSAGEGYDTVLLGQVGPTRINIDELEKRLGNSELAAVSMSLSEVGFKDAIDLLSTYGAQASDLAPWLANAEINHDRNLRLQYLAGLGLNHFEGGHIGSSITALRKFPDNIFLGTSMEREKLRVAIFGTNNVAN